MQKFNRPAIKTNPAIILDQEIKSSVRAEDNLFGDGAEGTGRDACQQCRVLRGENCIVGEGE
jgi:hypothetical protein